MAQSNEQGGEELREYIRRRLATTWQKALTGGHSTVEAAGTYFDDTIERQTNFLYDFILADRKQHELDASEIYVPVKGFEGLYEVSNKGNVRSIAGGRRRGGVLIQAPVGNKGLYRRVSLCRDGKSKGYTVHRLVAEAFISNPEHKRTVNHKDGNPSNNNLENLEWATYSENSKHAHEKLGVVVHNAGVRFVATHCPQGHEFTPENSYFHPTSLRMCRMCNKLRLKARRERKAALKAERDPS